MTATTKAEHAQPEALRLAESITRMDTFTDFQRQELDKAAAKLCSLHAQVAALTAAPQGGAYVENPVEIEHVAGDVSKNRAESNMTGGAYAELPEFEELDDDLIDLACSTGALYRVDFRRAWEVVREGLRASHGQAPAKSTPYPGCSYWGMRDTPATAQPAPAAPFSRETQDQIAAVMLQHGTEDQQRAALAYASGAAPAVATTYVSARECHNCGHAGINDDHATDAACNSCGWHGPSPEKDHCPGCGRDGTMTTACPMCSGVYVLVAEAHIPTPTAQPAPAAGAVAGPVNRIPLLDENDQGCALVRTSRGWDFRRNGNMIRQLNIYERLFVESALAAAPTPAAQGDAEDAARLDFLESHPEMSLRHRKGQWALKGFTNYEYDLHPSLRAAIDAERAALAQQEGKV